MFAPRRAALASAVALVAGAPVLTGCTITTSATPRVPGSVVIGLLAPTNDGTAVASRPAVQGARLAVDVVNVAYPGLPLPLGASAGLARGSRISLVVADTKGDGETGGQATDSLVRQAHPAGIVVADSADVVRTVSRHTEDALVPLVDAAASADYLAELGHEWYFRIGPSDRMMLATALAAVRQGTPAARRVVVLDGAGGQVLGGAPDLPDLAQARGFAVVARLPLGVAGAGAAELADRVGAQRPDAVVALAGTAAEAAAAGEVAQRLKGVPVVALGPGINGAGADLRGVLCATGWSADFTSRNPVARAVGELYRQRYGAPMNEAAANAFTSVLTLAVAVDKVGTTDTTAVRAALRQVDLSATEIINPWDGVRFDTDGQNPLAGSVVEQWVGDGPRIAYPRELAPRGAQ
ncbi:ABC transporter substrate-binding protein [Planosporangium sp. 12N6]|uniref:ABC transporter substrate-binding protein n=1 Tax=Planosporangium spinosum TaxID=3402278 RepID=UPI003CE68225